MRSARSKQDLLLNDGVLVGISFGTASTMFLVSAVDSMLSAGAALAADSALAVSQGAEASTPVFATACTSYQEVEWPPHNYRKVQFRAKDVFLKKGSISFKGISNL